MKFLIYTFLFLFGVGASAAPLNEVTVEFAAYLSADLCETPDLDMDCKSADGDFRSDKLTLIKSGDYFRGTTQLSYIINGFMHKATIGISVHLRANNQLGEYFFSIRTEFAEGTESFAFATGAVFADKPESLNDIFIDINPVQVSRDQDAYYFPFILIGSSKYDKKVLKAKARQQLIRRNLR